MSYERDLKKTFLEFLKWHITRILKCEYQKDIKDKIKKAFESNCKSITIRFKVSDLYGEDVIALTKSKVDRLVEAYEEKKGLTIRMSKMQIAHNAKIGRGVLPVLAGLIPFLTGTVLPALEVGALSGLASTGVKTLIGNWLYI